MERTADPVGGVNEVIISGVESIFDQWRTIFADHTVGGARGSQRTPKARISAACLNSRSKRKGVTLVPIQSVFRRLLSTLAQETAWGRDCYRPFWIHATKEKREK